MLLVALLQVDNDDEDKLDPNELPGLTWVCALTGKCWLVVSSPSVA